MKYDDFGSLAYIQSIRNRTKQDYAKAYAWYLKHSLADQPPTHDGLSYMAAKAVRLRLEGFRLDNHK